MTSRHILVAYDLSPLSDRAVERGFRLADEMRARLTVLHVVDGSTRDTADARDKAYTQLELMLRELSSKTKQEADYRIENGDPVETILGFATREKTDLIVLGLHKKDSISDWFMDSTAERLIRKSTFPILTVQNKPVRPYKRVLTAVDFSTCSRKALQTALKVAPDATVSAAHIYDFPFPVMIGLTGAQEKSIKEDMLLGVRGDAAADMAHFLAPFGKGQIVEILENGDVKYQLDKLIARIQPDLLALGTHGRSGFVTAIIGSVALSFLNNPPCDILITKGY